VTVTPRFFIGLGGNIGDPPATFRICLQALEERGLARLVQVSSLWRSPAQLGVMGGDFFNAVAELESACSPARLMTYLLALELGCGRVRGSVAGSRPVDLDILAWSGGAVDQPRLCVPHPGTASRRFVLEPFAEIAPDFALPEGRVADVLQRARRGGSWCRKQDAPGWWQAPAASTAWAS
jgi:2-amino-4-hydroxy-6-hydroxymethyldihydropteridine diphosphokinase